MPFGEWKKERNKSTVYCKAINVWLPGKSKNLLHFLKLHTVDMWNNFKTKDDTWPVTVFMGRWPYNILGLCITSVLLQAVTVNSTLSYWPCQQCSNIHVSVQPCTSEQFLSALKTEVTSTALISYANEFSSSPSKHMCGEHLLQKKKFIYIPHQKGSRN